MTDIYSFCKAGQSATTKVQLAITWGSFRSEGSADAIAVAPDGGLVVVNSDRILRLSKDGTIVYDNPSIAGTTLGDTIFINGAAVDGSGNVFVIDTFEVAVFKFNPSGNFADQMGVEGEGPGFLEAAPTQSPRTGSVASTSQIGTASKCWNLAADTRDSST